MFKVNNKDTRMVPIGIVLVSLLLTLNIFWHCSGVFIFNFEHILPFVLCSSVSIVNFEHVNVGWDIANIFNPFNDTDLIQYFRKYIRKTDVS